MNSAMIFPTDWKQFLEDYSFCDHKEVYTNGARLISCYRVEQMMHHYLAKATRDTVPVVHGHWERTKDGAAYCSACKRKMNGYLYGYAHCALCGATMDEERR